MIAASAGGWRVFKQKPSIQKNTFIDQDHTTRTAVWMALTDSATIELPHLIDAAGSISDSMASVVSQTDEREFFDELDAEIALMSQAEVLEAVLASAGMWADRDDLDELMDRTDRIDQLYAPYKKPNNPDPNI